MVTVELLPDSALVALRRFCAIQMAVIIIIIFCFQQIVNELLGRYNKRLDAEQMASLLAKQSSENPLWLSIACEELRVFGQFRELSDKINHLADGLLE